VNCELFGCLCLHVYRCGDVQYLNCVFGSSTYSEFKNEIKDITIRSELVTSQGVSE